MLSVHRTRCRAAHLVEVKKDVRTVRNLETVRPLDARATQRLQLLKERRKVHNCTITQQVDRVRVYKPAREQVKCKLLPVHDDRVARIGTAVEARDDIIAAG